MTRRGALLVGSVPLEDAASVFRTVAARIGGLLRRIPDGETGERKNWIAWQLGVFAAMPGLESEIFDAGYIKRAKFRLKPGVDPAKLRFPPLGYSAAAIASYAQFRRLRDAGEIPAHLRFEVCLPTPVAGMTVYVFPESQRAVEPAYEARLLQELDEILAAVPHGDLAIQWDVAIEFAILEGVMQSHFADPEHDILERLARIGACVPRGVELGYHLCYGDAGGRHFKEPTDTALMVRVANALAQQLARPLDWIHMPVPRSRDDTAYFAPLADLQLDARTELYLGLVHAADGAEGARRRIAAASRFAPRFGVATECGLGRQAPESIPALVDLHRQILEQRESADA